MEVAGEKIAGVIVRGQDPLNNLRCITLHGAGKSTKETILEVITAPAIEESLGILAIDFSGHGKSTGTLSESSLKKRVLEGQVAINHYLDKENGLVVCGVSMGGYIAIKMLELFSVETLILFCPALYDGAAFDVPFDQRFTEIIRSFESWRNTDVLASLESFRGKLLVVMGADDTVIPPGVIQLIDQHTLNVCKKEIYTIADCPHKIDEWIKDNPVELLKLQKKIKEYIKVDDTYYNEYCMEKVNE